MFGLLYKDLCNMKKDLIILMIQLAVVSLYIFIPWESMLEEKGGATEIINGYTMAYVFTPVFAYGVMSIFISLVQKGIFSHDERRVWAYYMTSSPLIHEGQVLSKYYLNIGLSALILVFGMVCDMLCPVVIGTQGSAGAIYVTFFFVQVFFKSIEMPFVIRYGQKHGRSYKLLMFVGLLFVAVVYLLFGPLPDISLDDAFDLIMKFLSNQAAVSTTFLGVVAIAPYVVILMYYISYKISCKLYLKGVDTYDT